MYIYIQYLSVHVTKEDFVKDRQLIVRNLLAGSGPDRRRDQLSTNIPLFCFVVSSSVCNGGCETLDAPSF